MARDSLIDKLKSPIIRNELIKHIDKINVVRIAQGIHEHLDIQMTDKDVKIVEIVIKNKLAQLIQALK